MLLVCALIYLTKHFQLHRSYSVHWKGEIRRIGEVVEGRYRGLLLVTSEFLCNDRENPRTTLVSITDLRVPQIE